MITHKPLDYRLLFVCGLIEHVGRAYGLERHVVVNTMGRETLQNLYDYADVFHCQSLEDNLVELEEYIVFPKGNYTTHVDARFYVPSEYEVARVYVRLIQDLGKEGVDGVFAVYNSFLSGMITDYSNHVLFTPAEILRDSFVTGMFIAS